MQSTGPVSFLRLLLLWALVSVREHRCFQSTLARFEQNGVCSFNCSASCGRVVSGRLVPCMPYSIVFNTINTWWNILWKDMEHFSTYIFSYSYIHIYLYIYTVLYMYYVRLYIYKNDNIHMMLGSSLENSHNGFAPGRRCPRSWRQCPGLWLWLGRMFLVQLFVNLTKLC